MCGIQLTKDEEIFIEAKIQEAFDYLDSHMPEINRALAELRDKKLYRQEANSFSEWFHKKYEGYIRSGCKFDPDSKTEILSLCDRRPCTVEAILMPYIKS